jgi:FkbM family methyltransferase
MPNAVNPAAPEAKEISYREYAASLRKKRVMIYGAGGVGTITADLLKNSGCNLDSFLDDDPQKQGTLIDGIKVISVQEALKNPGGVILVCTPNFADVSQKLEGCGCSIQRFPVMMSQRGFYSKELLRDNRQKIKLVSSLWADDFSKKIYRNLLKHRLTMNFLYLNECVCRSQYFPGDLFTLGPEECFVDGGACRGETIAALIRAAGGHFGFIYGFEPDQKNYTALRSNLSLIEPSRKKLLNAGLSDKSGQMNFNSRANGASSFSENGSETIRLVALDEIAMEHSPTYIKLDVEGAEAKALCGMRRNVAAFRPRLAVSVYHKPADLWGIPLLLNRMFPFYRLFLRHYTDSLLETVCYAI